MTTPATPATPPVRCVAILGVAAGVLSGAIVWFYYTHYAPDIWSDIDQVWLGARALLRGQDPYAEVPKTFPWPLYYPLPALLLGLPLVPLPLPIARIVFAAVTAAVCAWALLRHRPHAWPMLCSAPFIYSLLRGQWAPWLVAGALVPWLGGVAAAKPSIGLATFAYRPTRQTVIGGIVLGLLSFMAMPHWVGAWLASIRLTPHFIRPAFLPLGVVLLAALLRWRRPDARLLAVLALVPQTAGIYELFPLALVPRSQRQALILATCFNLTYIFTLATHDSRPIVFAEVPTPYYPVYWPATLLFAYLPSLWMVLWPLPMRERPNTFPSWPAWRQQWHTVGWTALVVVLAIVTIGWAWVVWAAWIRPMFG